MFQVIDINDKIYFEFLVCKLIFDLKRGYLKLEIYFEEIIGILKLFIKIGKIKGF